MKRVLFTTVFAIIMISLFFTPVAYAEHVDSVAYDYMAEFVTKYERRGNDTTCTEYLVEKFKSFGLDPFYSSGYTDDFDFAYSANVTYFSKNVAAVKKGNSSENTVVIGAGYDNVAGWSNDISANGAYSSGSGVGVLLALAEKFSSETFGFDIVFVCYGAEQMGYCGSGTFLRRLSTEQIKSIILYIDLNSLGAGDNLYMYCGETERLHESYFKDVGAEAGAKLADIPDDKKIIAVQSDVTGLPYTHAMLDSALAYYYAKDINCVGFKSFNWDLEFIGYYRESASHQNIAYTKNDDLNTLAQYYGDDAKVKMNDVVSTVSAGLSKDSFLQTMKDSALNIKKQDFTVWRILYAVAVGLIFVLIIVLLIMKNKVGHTDNNNTVGQNETFENKDENVFDEFGI